MLWLPQLYNCLSSDSDGLKIYINGVLQELDDDGSGYVRTQQKICRNNYINAASTNNLLAHIKFLLLLQIDRYLSWA